MQILRFIKVEYLGVLIISIMGLFFCAGEIKAHPLDITATELHVLAGDTKIDAHTYVHPFLIGMFLKEHDCEYDSTKDYYNYKEEIAGYLSSCLVYKNNNDLCRISSFNFPPMDEFELMGGGMEIDYQVDCSSEIARLDFVNQLFIEYSNLQTNKMMFFLDSEVLWFQKDGRDEMEMVMTAKVISSFFDFKDKDQNNVILLDTDKDGLADEEEKLYGTDIEIPDSDFDGYTDKEEVDSGWYPTVAKASPGQTEKVLAAEAEKQYHEYYGEKTKETIVEPAEVINFELDGEATATVVSQISQPLAEGLGKKSLSKEAVSASKPSNSSTSKEIVITSQEREGARSLDSSKYFKTGRLQQFLGKIKLLFDKGDKLSLAIIFVLIYVLGVLHAFESGHGKSILVSYLMEHDRSRKDALLFATVMTITHLIDVIILSLVFKVLSVSTNIYNLVNGIQKIGAVILLCMGLYYLIKNFIPRDSHEKNTGGYKKVAWLGIIAGLAPCTIGWAIMVILLSIGKINLLIPVIIVFGLGIWTTLLCFGLLLVGMKNKFISKAKGLARWSSILSAVLLIAISLVLLLK